MPKIKIIHSLLQKKVLFFVLFALIISVFSQALFFRWTNDDAFISYRYVKNLTSGEGLVFNPGEKVEGFSNFLWVIMLSFLDFLGFPPLWSSKIISFCISLLMILLIFRTAQAFGLNKFISGLCSLTLSLSSGLAYFSMSGMETVFYTLLLLLAIYINEKYENKPTKKIFNTLYGILFAVAIARPEGILLLFISTIYHLFKKIISKKGIYLKTILRVQFIYFLIYIFLMILRYLYYSDILPNAYYAKPKGTFVEQGYSAFYTNFMNALLSGSFLLIPIFILLVKYCKKYTFPYLILVGQLIFMFYAGDWMAFGRFFLPILPIVITLIALLSQETFLRARPPYFNKLVIFSSVIIWIFYSAGNVYQTHSALPNKNKYPYLVMNSQSLIELGKNLSQNYPLKTTIAVRRIGAISYYSNLRIIDILGLTDKKIAYNIKNIKNIETQNEVNSRIVLEKEPDLIILFSFESDIAGYVYDKANPQYKLFEIEYLIFKNALNNGYKIIEEKKFGSNEKMIILTK